MEDHPVESLRRSEAKVLGAADVQKTARVVLCEDPNVARAGPTSLLRRYPQPVQLPRTSRAYGHPERSWDDTSRESDTRS